MSKETLSWVTKFNNLFGGRSVNYDGPEASYLEFKDIELSGEIKKFISDEKLKSYKKGREVGFKEGLKKGEEKDFSGGVSMSAFSSY